MLSFARAAHTIVRLSLANLSHGFSNVSAPTVIRTSMPTARPMRATINTSVIPTTGQKKRAKNADVKQIVEDINKNYSRTNVRVRQIAGRILKEDKRSRLFLMLRNLIRIPNYSTTHLVLIFGRLVEIEKYYREKKKTPSKSVRIPLAEHPFFYKCLHSIEVSIERMQGSDLAFLMKTINKAGFLRINFFPVVTAIDDYLSADNHLELVDKIAVTNLFFHFVQFRKGCDEEEEACLKEVTGSLIKATFKQVREQALLPLYYFKIAKYSYLLKLNGYSKINMLHKTLLKHRKLATAINYYHWFLLTTLENSDKGNMPIVMNDIVNKKVFRRLKLRQNVKMLKKVLNFELEDNQVLKKVFIKQLVEAIKMYLKIIVDRSIVDKNLYKLSMFLMKTDKNYKEFNEELKQICDKGLFVNNEDHQLMVYFFKNKIEPSFDHIKRVCENGKFTHLAMSTVFSLYDEISKKKYDVDKTGLHKKMVKIFVRSAPFLARSRQQNVERMVEIFVRNPSLFKKYFDYLSKKINKIGFIKLTSKKPKGEKDNNQSSKHESLKDVDEDFDLAEEDDELLNDDDDKEIAFENPEVPEEYFLRRVKITNVFLLFHLNFLNNWIPKLNPESTGVSVSEIDRLIKMIGPRMFAKYLNERQVLFVKGLAENPASDSLKTTFNELVEEVIKAQEDQSS